MVRNEPANYGVKIENLSGQWAKRQQDIIPGSIDFLRQRKRDAAIKGRNGKHYCSELMQRAQSELPSNLTLVSKPCGPDEKLGEW